MILKSFLLEQNISLIDKYFINLIYGENIGMKDDIKNQIKIHFKNHEKILFTQDELLKNKSILTEQVENTSLFSSKKIIGGECATPGIISLIAACNNKKIKNLLKLNEKSNVLVMGCEGNADATLYNKLLSQGLKKI